MDDMEIASKLFLLSSKNKPFSFYYDAGTTNIGGHVGDTPIGLIKEDGGVWRLYVYVSTWDMLTHNAYIDWWDIGEIIDDIYTDANFDAHIISHTDDEVYHKVVKCYDM